jgi:SAM-dependent methyltransferase
MNLLIWLTGARGGGEAFAGSAGRGRIAGMKLTVAGENLFEKLVVALGIPPVTLVDTHMSFIRARAIMVGVKLGVFDALTPAPLTARDVAARCQTAPAGTEKLLNALVGAGYLAYRDRRYGLTTTARKWVTRDSPTSVVDKVLFEFVEWDLVEHFEEYVKTGRPLEMHQTGSEEQWTLYQRAMRALSGFGAPEIVRRTPMPAGATRMLDVGGSHGFVSVAMCRKYPQLSAVVLDLPAAVRQAAPILAKEGMGDRVIHRAGNALTDDLGTNEWDLIYVSQLLHHFDEPTNREFVRRAARALKPNGVLVVLELIRPRSPGDGGQTGALLDLYFALTSQSGTWSVEEMTGWQRDAGLAPRKPIYLRTLPGAAEVVAAKQAAW